MREQKTGGITLLLGGALLLLGALFIVPSTPLAAAGMSALIVGYTSIVLAGTLSMLSTVRADDRTSPRDGNARDLDCAIRENRRVILSLGLSYVAIDLVLAATRQSDIGAYLVANTILFLIIAIANSGMRREAKRALGTTASFLFVGFLIALAIKLATAA